LQGGTLLWEIIERMQLKAKCLDEQFNGRSFVESIKKEKLNWVEREKFYTISLILAYLDIYNRENYLPT
jgi:hypothetical protein